MKKILLTGDDGYKSPGIRLLVNILKKEYDVTVVGTKQQQSGVGGKLSLYKGFDWKTTTIDGVPAIWVDGTPVDCMELASQYFEKKHFDMVISGMNWGANLGSALFGSGTMGAALRSTGEKIANKTIAMSWDLPPGTYLEDYNKSNDSSIDEYIKYPGESITKIIDLAIKEKFWNTDLINVNFPKKYSNKVVITKPFIGIDRIFSNHYDPKQDDKDVKHFIYKVKRIFDRTIDSTYDVGAMTQGFISISPLQATLLDKINFPKVEKKHYQI